MSIASIMFRKVVTKLDAKRDEGLKTPEDIYRFDNISYGLSEVWNVLDVYKPKEKKNECLPVIISVHGGGWVYGDKELYQFYCMNLAQKGFAVINFTYGLAPKYKFPSQIEDVNQVVCWMYENAEKYGFDLEHVFMVGDSAGAHLTSLYSCICTNPEYAKTFPSVKVPNHFVPTALGLNCGVYRVMKNMDANNTIKLMKDLLGRKAKEKYDWISPALYITERFPPVYLMTAKGDFLIKQAPILKEALEKKNIKHVYKIYGTDSAPLYHVFHCNMKEEEGLRCNEEECEFFKQFL